jgi:hypothetical protein
MAAQSGKGAAIRPLYVPVDWQFVVVYRTGMTKPLDISQAYYLQLS